ncbi:putative ribosylation factor GTPase-activating protein cnt6 [Colletotrichum spaethianum]|uniref:Ribosylation factor GTPase-activating protein cnt6 n=1 Tax=Colletotrichum spaethianum TaxID=700344 RepID=A0AA37NXK2_9PEZI|nr:putative ribosylation factor GTPase-activating protein cnt6 [Colletotrichum spaethianum]GKT45307.1 putative ribosylation factor GTPase-activating protein cnt6 [Colletotrichum spaethianum]
MRNPQTLKASKALLAHIKKAAKEKSEESGKKNLLADPDDEEGNVAQQPIWLTLTTKRHIADSARLKPGKITLPHPLNTDEESTICLITADPQRAYKNIVASDEFPEALRKRITRVVDLGKLKSKFKQYEAQRKLFAEHDIFLADDRIVSRLPKALGKTFYKTTAKRPIPVILSAKAPRGEDPGTVNAGTPQEIAAEIEKAIGAALVSLTPSTNTAIRIGYAGFSADQIADNVTAVVKTLIEKWVPQKWQNVKSIYIKGQETAALPVWLTDELWLEQKDIVADDSEQAKAIKEKANVGKKRKSIGAAEGDEEETSKPTPKKAKKAAKEAQKALPESNDDALNKQIAERKDKLKKQKAKAKAALDN